MDIRFEDSDLDRLETDSSFSAGFPASIVKAFRMRMQWIRSSPDERSFYGLRSFRFEKMKRSKLGEYSMRLNDQWRLIIRFEGEGKKKVVVVVAITDYH
jgi:proteic killer suppression protein